MSYAGSRGYEAIPLVFPDEEQHRRMLAQRLNGATEGRINAFIDVEVTASDVTTVITDPRITVFSFFGVMAFDANGAADITAGIYWDNVTNGTATMNHRSDGSTRTLRILIIG